VVARASAKKEGVGVGKVRIMKRIEPLGEMLYIAAYRSAEFSSLTAIDPFPQNGCSTHLCHDVLVLHDEYASGAVE
jgi:hypothetical protein